MKNRIVVLLIMIVGLSYSQETKKALFIGNSYTYSNNLPGLIDSLATHSGNVLFKDQHTPGGMTLSGHYENALILQKISNNNWDKVILQAQSQEPSFPWNQAYNSTLLYGDSLSDSIYANDECSVPLFFGTWGRRDGDQQWDSINTFHRMNERLYEGYSFMAENNSGMLAPVGIAFHHIYSDQNSIVSFNDLYNPDGSHPSIYGSYLAALIFYEQIFEESPLNNTFRPSSISQNESEYLKNVANFTLNNNDTIVTDYRPIALSTDFTYDEYIGNEIHFSSVFSNSNFVSWEFGDGNLSTDINPIHIYNNSGNYSVTLTVEDNCHTYSFEKTISVGISSLNENNLFDIKLYPNPSIGKVNVTSNKNFGEVNLLNVKGKIVDKFVISKGESQINISSKGTYFLVNSEGASMKIIVD